MTPSVRRRPLVAVMLGSLAIGIALMIPFEAPVTRILGVAALFTFIVSGVFLIADPAFLGPEEDHASGPDQDLPAFSEPEPG